MDELEAHFLVMIGEACAQARTARLPVEVVLLDGRTVTGVPNPQESARDDREQVDTTGFSSRLEVGGETVRLDEVAELRLRSPARQLATD